MIKPTVGRIVWFWPSGNSTYPEFCAPSAGEPCAAIVVKVWRDDCVNLTVFDANGVAHSKTSVPLIQAGQVPPEEGFYAEWMPYQKAVAAGEIEPAKHAG